MHATLSAAALGTLLALQPLHGASAAQAFSPLGGARTLATPRALFVPPGTGISRSLNPQPIPPGRGFTGALNPQPIPPGRGLTQALNPQPIPPGRGLTQALNPQPIPPGRGLTQALNPQPIPPGRSMASSLSPAAPTGSRPQIDPPPIQRAGMTQALNPQPIPPGRAATIVPIAPSSGGSQARPSLSIGTRPQIDPPPVQLRR